MPIVARGSGAGFFVVCLGSLGMDHQLKQKAGNRLAEVSTWTSPMAFCLSLRKKSERRKGSQNLLILSHESLGAPCLTVGRLARESLCSVIAIIINLPPK
jgi:hypothetical protein